ncbi:MAG TPA: helix-turn-helix transcriptional regulator [Clostridiales bacterium]|nr:helix-turn-helix transcriptional regulator [Clostridiales bacterium]
MNKNLTFGGFLSEIRKSKGVLSKDLAMHLGVSAVYICDVEKDRKAAPKSEYLEKISEYLGLSNDEQNTMYDLAATEQACKKGISPDLPDYIMEKDIVRTALRTAKQYNIDDDEWLEFIEKIKRKSKK